MKNLSGENKPENVPEKKKKFPWTLCNQLNITAVFPTHDDTWASRLNKLTTAQVYFVLLKMAFTDESFLRRNRNTARF